MAFVPRLGWVEAPNLAIEYRWAEGRRERFAEIAAEFARLKIDCPQPIVSLETKASQRGDDR